MKLILTNQTQTRVPKSLFTALLKRLPQIEPSATHDQVELLLTGNAEIHALNKTYRHKDAPTDVLSFPFDDPKNLGQIVISVEKAQEQAQVIGQPLQKELEFLFAHGLLHLLGHDHEEPEEEKLMLQKTYELLQRTRLNP